MLRFAIFALAALLILAPLAQSATALAYPDRSAQQMAGYLSAHIPIDTQIETWEPELGALTDHRYHYPPIALLDTAVRHTWLNGPALVYDGLATRPPYVVVGAFGSWVQIYSADTLQHDYAVEYTAGPYTLYHLK